MATVVDTIIWKGVFDTSGADFAGFSGKAKRELSGFQKNFKTFNNEVGKGLSTTTKLFFDFAVDSAKALAEFETAFTDVAKQVDLEGTFDDAATEMGAFAKAIREVSLDELKGALSAEAFAGVVAGSAQLGVAEENLLSFSTGVGQVATALDTNIEKTSTALAKIIKQFDLTQTAENVTAVGSSINEISQSTTATAEEVFNLVGRMTGTATTMGLEIDELVGIAGALRDNVPISIQKSATAMNKFLLSMTTDSASFVDAFQLDAEEFARLMKENPVQALTQVTEAMQNLKEEEGADALLNTMGDIVGKGEGITQLVLNLAGAQDSITAAVQTSTEAYAENVSAANEFGVVTETQAARFTRLGEQWTELQRQGGEVLKPFTDFLLNTAIGAMDELLNNGENFVNILAESINEAFGGMALIPEEIGSLYAGFFADTQGHLDELKEHAGSVTKELALMLIEPFDGLIAKVQESTGFVADAFESIALFGKGGQKASENFLGELENMNDQFEIMKLGSQELKTEYTEMTSQLNQAIKSNVAPSAELIDQFNQMRFAIKQVGVEAYGGSTFPDMEASMQSAQGQAQELTQEMGVMEAEIAGLGAEYERTDALIKENQRTVQALIVEIRNQQAALRVANDEEKEGIRNIIIGLQNKKAVVQNDISVLKEQGDVQKATIQEAEQGLKGLEDEYKNVENSIKDIARETEILEKEFTSFFTGLDEETQDWLFSQENIVEILRDMGKEIGETEAALIEQVKAQRMIDKSAEEAEQALFDMAHAEELAAEAAEELAEQQRDAAEAAREASETMWNAYSNIGDLFGVIGGQFGEIGQNLFELPGIVGGITSAFSGLGGITGILSGGLATLIPGLGTLAPIIGAAIPVVRELWSSFTDLFDDGVSQGGQATATWQEFIAGVEGGGEALANAIGNARNEMDFDDQFAQLNRDTTDLWAVFASVPTAESPFDEVFSSLAEVDALLDEQRAKGIDDPWADIGDETKLNALKEQFEGLAEAGAITEEQSATLNKVFERIALDGQVTSEELERLKSAMQEMGAEESATGLELMRQKMEELGIPAEKVEQTLLQTFAAMQEQGMGAQEMMQTLASTMGLSAEETEKMAEEMNAALLEMGTIGEEGEFTGRGFDELNQSTEELAESTSELNDDTAELGGNMQTVAMESQVMSNSLTSAGSKTIQTSEDFDSLSQSADNLAQNLSSVRFSLEEISRLGTNVEGFAAGGIASGMAIVNERGPEIAQFPGGSQLFMSGKGPQLGFFPAGTRIVPHGRSMSMLRQNPNIPRMQAGGTITTNNSPISNTLNINGGLINRKTIKQIYNGLDRLKKRRA